MNPPDSNKISAVAKRMEDLRQPLDELGVEGDIAVVEVGIPCGTGMGYDGYGDSGHMDMGYR